MLRDSQAEALPHQRVQVLRDHDRNQRTHRQHRKPRGAELQPLRQGDRDLAVELWVSPRQQQKRQTVQKVEQHQGKHRDVQSQRKLFANYEQQTRRHRQRQSANRRRGATIYESKPARRQTIFDKDEREPRRNDQRRIQGSRDRHDGAQCHKSSRAPGQIDCGHFGHRRAARPQTRARQHPERDRRHQYEDQRRRADSFQKNHWQTPRAVFRFSRRLGQRFKAGVRKENRRQAQGESSRAVSNERRVVGRMDRKQSGNYQHANRKAQQHAHGHLDPAKPAHADHVHDVEKKQAAHGECLVSKLATDTFSGELDYVIRQRTGQVRAGADVGDDLQPRADVGNAKPAERARDVQIFTARLATQRR